MNDIHEQDFEYDKYGRLKYHPELHPRHGQPYTEEDKEYLCKFWEVDGRRLMSYALGRPEHSLDAMIYTLRKKGLFNHYKNLNKHW